MNTSSFPRPRCSVTSEVTGTGPACPFSGKTVQSDHNFLCFLRMWVTFPRGRYVVRGWLDPAHNDTKSLPKHPFVIKQVWSKIKR